MGHVQDALEDAAVGGMRIEELGAYVSQLARSEQSYVDKRHARSVAISVARDALFMQQVEIAFRDNLPSFIPKIPKPRAKAQKRVVNLLLSDLHFGAALPEAELPTATSAVTEARRFGRVIQEACDYKLDHRDQSTCNVYVMGDIIQGVLKHLPRTGNPLTEQFCVAVSYISQGIARLAQVFQQVNVHWQSGNHGRNVLTHPGRATAMKWDSYETMVGIAIREKLSHVGHVNFSIPRTPYSAVDVFGSKIFATHGDTVLNVGNPGKSLRIDRIAAQIDSINSTRRYGSAFDVFLCGHVHQAVSMPVSGAHLLINGALTPPDGFADSLGLFSRSGQHLWESVEGYPVGDQRLVLVGARDDADEKLDGVITPMVFGDLL